MVSWSNITENVILLRRLVYVSARSLPTFSGKCEGKKKSLRRFEACAGLLERCDVKCRNDHERCDVKCRNDHERGSFFSRCSQDFQWMNTCRYATDLHPFFLSLRGMERRGIVTISIMTWNHALARWCWCWQTNKQTKREQVAKDWRWWRKELTFWSVREI